MTGNIQNAKLFPQTWEITIQVSTNEYDSIQGHLVYVYVRTTCCSSMLLDSNSLTVELVIDRPLGQLRGPGGVKTALKRGTSGGSAQLLRGSLGQTKSALSRHGDLESREIGLLSFQGSFQFNPSGFGGL